jgi:hypothetical protein
MKVFYISAVKPFYSQADAVPFVRNRQAEVGAVHFLLTHSLQEFVNHDFNVSYLNLCYHNEKIATFIKLKHQTVCGIPSRLLGLTKLPGVSIRLTFAEFRAFRNANDTYASYVSDLFELWEIPEAQILDFSVLSSYFMAKTDSSLSNVLDEAKNMMQKFQGDTDGFIPVVGIISHFYTASLSTWKDIVASILVVCSIYRLGDLNALMKLIHSFLPKNVPESQSLSEMEDGWTVGFPVLATLASILILKKIPTSLFLKNMISNSSNVSRLLATGPQAFSNLIVIFEYVYDYVLLKVFGKQRQHLADLETMIDGLTEWESAVNDVLALDFRSQIVKSRDACLQIEKLFFEGNRLSNQLNKLHLDTTQKVHFNRIHNQISNLYTLVDNIGATPYEPREVPIALYITGSTGVGKSTMTPLIALECMKLISPSLVLDYNNQVYYRNVTQEYWDGYQNQSVTIYDDFAQLKDSQTAPNLELLEIIKTGNIAPYPLHKASLAEKSKSFFNSKFIICTSNQKRPAVSSLVAPEAVYRRFAIAAEMFLDPRVTTCGKRDPKKQQAVLGTTGLDPNTVRFNVYSLNDYGTIFGDLSFKEYISLVSHAYNKSGAVDKQLLSYIASEQEKIRNAKPQTYIPIVAAQSVDDPVLPIEYFDDADYEQFAENPIVELHSHFKLLAPIHNYYEQYILDPVSTTKLLLERKLIQCREFVASNYNWSFSILKHPVVLTAGLLLGLLTAYVTYKKFSTSKTPVSSVPIGEMSSGDSKTARVVRPVVEMSSGDVKTSHVSRPVVEMSSGDSKTSRLVRPVVEMSSGDSKTSRLVRPVVEMSSGDSKTSRVAQPVVETVESEGILDQNSYEIVNYALPYNTYRLYTKTGDETKQRLNGVFIHGRSLLTVAHFLPYFDNCDFVILKGIKQEFVIPRNEISIAQIKTTYGEDKDAILLSLPRYIPPHKSLLKYFCQRSDLSRYTSVPICLFVLQEQQNQLIMSTTPTQADSIDGLTYVSGATTLVMRKGYKYRSRTVKGDCGALLVAEAPSIVRKLIGIHVAGQPGFGYGLSLTREDIQQALDCFPLESTIGDADIPIAHCGHYTPEGSFSPIGVNKETYMQPMRTTIRESLIHGKIAPITTAPSQLRPSLLVNPLEVGLKKAGIQPPYIPQKYLDRAYKSIKSKFLHNNKRFSRKLSRDEAVAGIEGEPFICSMNRQASSGFGWLKKTPPNYPGKTYWLGAEENFKIDEEVHSALDNFETCLNNNVRLPVVWIDTLKDERRSLEKVKAGKTRVFAAGQMDYIILFRQYFLGFIADTMERRIDNEVGVGINPEGPDWQKLALHLTKFSDNVIAGDFSNYDGSLSAQVLKLVLDLVNEWYDDEFSNHRSLIFEEICHSIHVNGSNLYQWTHSQPSGNPFTAVLNSIANMIYNRVCFYALTENTPLAGQNFESYVSMIAYGDDNILGVHPDAHEYFNCASLTRAMSKFGMTYTDEKKTGMINDFRRLDQVGFLKRAFVLRNALWRAPLELEVILESLNWIRGPNNDKLSLEQNLQTQLENLACHGPEIFNQWIVTIEKAVQSVNLQFPFNTYEGYEELLLCRYFAL